MPLHNFICDKCNIITQDVTMKGIHECPECGEDMRWDCRVGIHGNYRTPIHSDALAISPTQKAEHERLFPNVRLDGDCRPVFDKFVDHENYMKKVGVTKRRQKIKTKGKRIA